jgi:hypothetical protein
VNEFTTFLTGGTAMACLAIGLYFLRSWRRTGDRFFLIFGLAFWVFAANRVALVSIGDENEAVRTGVYVIRLAAFLLILAAIVDKNLRSTRSR